MLRIAISRESSHLFTSLRPSTLCCISAHAKIEIPTFEDSQDTGLKCRAQIQSLLGAILPAKESMPRPCTESPSLAHTEDATIVASDCAMGCCHYPANISTWLEGVVTTIEAAKMPSSLMSASMKTLTDVLLLYSNQDAMPYRLWEEEDVTILCRSHITVDRSDYSSSSDS